MEDASLTTKGVVKLSSAVDSTSESLAATPKAVKTVKDSSVQKTGDTMGGQLKIGTINALRIFNQAFGLIFRRSEDYIHLIPTNEGEGENGDIGSLRPFSINLRSGLVSIGNGLKVGGSVTGKLTGNADTATKIKTARKIGGVAFDGSADINLPGVNATGNQNTTGNAATATKLQAARTINGVSFDGSANITLTPSNIGALALTGGTLSGGLTAAGEIISKSANGLRIAYGNYGFFIRNDGSNTYFMLTDSGNSLGTYNSLRPFIISNSTGNVTIATKLNASSGITGSLSGNASTATKLQTARTIGGVSFDGTANINLPGVNAAGNQNTTGNAATATKLQTARTINGVSFNGSANISIPTITSRGRVTALTGTTQGAATGLQMYEAYNNGYPSSYGNVLHLKGATAVGEGELFIGWSGTSGAHAPVHVRSRRDTDTSSWSEWAQVYTSKDSIPGVNATGNQNTTGNAATATKLQTARTINGVSFNGSANISIPTITSRGRVTALTGTTQGAATGLQMYEAYNNGYPSSYGNVLHLKGATAVGEGELFIGWSGTSGAHAPVHVRSRRDTDTSSWSEWAQVYTSKDSIPGVNATGNQNTTGNAASATKLQTARTIGGVSFNGTANINLPGVNIAGNQNTTGNAASATKLQTARTIGGVSFNGTANINLPGVNTTGNQNTTGNAATATKLQTARKIAGVAFDGSADITLTAANLNAYTKTEVTNLLSSYVKSSSLPSMTVRTSSVSGGDMGMSLSTFISHLKSNGAFSKSYWIGFGDAMGFNAGSINNITGFGAVELAESIIEVFNLPNGDYTIRLTTSHKADYGGVTNAILVYHYRSNRSPSGQWLKFAGTVGATSN
nr:tail fiber protein [Escherichia coli]